MKALSDIVFYSKLYREGEKNTGIILSDEHTRTELIDRKKNEKQNQSWFIFSLENIDIKNKITENFCKLICPYQAIFSNNKTKIMQLFQVKEIFTFSDKLSVSERLSFFQLMNCDLLSDKSLLHVFFSQETKQVKL